MARSLDGSSAGDTLARNGWVYQKESREEESSMRTVLYCLIVVGFYGGAVYGAERAWTISYTTQAELVEVRGDTVFLKASDGVQSIPLDRLSDTDRQYVASLPLAPVSHSADGVEATTATLPSPSGENGAVEPVSFGPPQDGPSLISSAPLPGNERSVLVAPRGGVIQTESFEDAPLPTPATVPRQNPTSQVVPRSLDNSNRQPPLTLKQQKALQKAERKQAEADSRRGSFGGRNRRLLGDRD
jgi:hypothetical protein